LLDSDLAGDAWKERVSGVVNVRIRGAALVFSFEAEEASGNNCSSRLGARRTQADVAGLRRGQQGKDGGDRTRERARAAARFGSGSRCLVGEQRTTVASGL